MNRDLETNGLLATCKELGIGFVPWGPDGHELSDAEATRTNHFRSEVRSFSRPLFAPRKLLQRISLSWFLSPSLPERKAPRPRSSRSLGCWLKSPFIVPIPGTGKVKHLQDNIESTKLVLTAGRA